MKTIKFIALAFVAVIFASCGSSYSDEKAEKIIDKYYEEDELNKDDWKEATNLYCAYLEKETDAMESAIKKADTMKECEETLEEFYEENSKGADLGYIIRSHTDEIPSDCLKKFKETTKKIEKKQKELRKEVKKKFKYN